MYMNIVCLDSAPYAWAIYIQLNFCLDPNMFFIKS